MKKLALHTQIFLGILAGFAFAMGYTLMGIELSWVVRYIKPIGTLFLRTLKVMAVPLTITSLLSGLRNVEDAKRLSSIGRRAFLLYMVTTIFAVSLGLLLGRLLRPGLLFPEALRESLGRAYQGTVRGGGGPARSFMESLAALIPPNLFGALADNRQLLQVILMVLAYGIALMKVAPEKKALILSFCQAQMDVFVEMVAWFMRLAPLGVFSLTATSLIEVSYVGDQPDPYKILAYIQGLSWYVATVVLGLFLMTYLVYPLLIAFFSDQKVMDFLRAISPVQLMAFSTSSSTATLPLTLKCVERYLQVPKEISSFVLPLGATVNMDGTAIYQGIAAIFLAQVFGLELSLQEEVMIVAYVSLSSIGVAGAPGASLGSMSILLAMLGLPSEEAMAIIFLPDRFLDMLRTMTNVTGDAMVACLIASRERLRKKKLGEPA